MFQPTVVCGHHANTFIIYLSEKLIITIIITIIIINIIITIIIFIINVRYHHHHHHHRIRKLLTYCIMPAFVVAPRQRPAMVLVGVPRSKDQIHLSDSDSDITAYNWV